MTGILIALVVLGIIVVIHELGHFLVAKFFRIKVDTFSVGFGPRIAGFRYGETDYRLSALPLGGYVKMGGDGAADSPLSDSSEFTLKPRYQRFLVALAGPAMNVVLAVILFTALFMRGVPMPEYTAGGAVMTTGVVQKVVDDSPAQAAGIQAGDTVLRVHGIDVASSRRSIQEIVQDIPEETQRFVVSRNGQELELQIKPTIEKGQRKLGVHFQISTVLVKLGFVEALNRSIRTTEQYALLIFDTLGKLVKGETSWTDLVGPVGIVRVTGQAANQSLAELVLLMAVISLNLGIMNLLPIPILDGGTMLLLILETLMGRDLSLIVKERIMQAGLVLMLIIFVVVLYNDVIKWVVPSAL